MPLLIDSTSKDLSPWIEGIKKELNGSDRIFTWGELENPEEITTAIVWNHRPELFSRLPNVRLVCSLGAGVDHIMRDPLLPPDVLVSRVVSPYLSGPMSNFCLGAILYYQRKFDQYLIDKKNKEWHQEFNPERNFTIGIMGLGELGTDLAQKLLPLGFDVYGWSQSRKHVEGVTSYVADELELFLSSINVLVCLLPATPGTKGILSRPLFSKMNRGSYLINVARGHHQVNEDILEALKDGTLAGAFLDVFPEEPLPADSPMWEHPDVFITPHIAVVTKREAAIPQIVANHFRVIAGEEPENKVDRKKGY
ncbi:MAG: glyoxylate/hydroxypyruvate reductase A [Cyclobacteriaceae bacterium]|nr:glyoxylate/hydroxypyruvate reductase A [Cyclobacteriaceae bacterium]